MQGFTKQELVQNKANCHLHLSMSRTEALPGGETFDLHCLFFPFFLMLSHSKSGISELPTASAVLDLPYLLSLPLPVLWDVLGCEGV